MVDSFGRRLAGVNDSQLKSHDVKALMDLHWSHFAASPDPSPWLFLDNRDSRSILLFNRQYKFIIFAQF